MTDSNNSMKISGIFLAVIMLCGSIPLGFSEPLKVQLERGVEPENIQCDDMSHVLVQRPNGKLACVSERISERLGWEIMVTSNDVTSNDVKILEFDYGSDVEYVDDGREQHRAVLQKSPAPWDMYDKITDDLEKYSVDDTGLFRVPSTSHERFSIQEGVGFYPEDWLPTHIPNGYRLLFIDNMYYEPTGDSLLRVYYVPNTFVLNENTTNYDLDTSKGYVLSVNNVSHLLDEIEDEEENSKERFESESGYVGRYLDLTRDGEKIVAHEFQTDSNHYRSILAYNYDDHTAVSIISYYMTLEELQPVFDSVGR